MKSPPASMASQEARRTLSRVTSSPVSRITLRCAVAAGLLDRDDLLEDLEVAAGEERAAVDDHVDLVGAGGHGVPHVGELDRPGWPGRWGRRWRRRRRGRRCRPAPRGARRPGRGRRRRRRPAGSRVGRGRGGGPWRHSARTLPGVSGPSSVVRSTIEIASVDRPRLGGGLDRAGAQHRRAGLGADLVDPGQAVQEGAEGLVRAGHVGERVRQGARGGAGIGQRVRVQHVGHARHSPLPVTRSWTGCCGRCGTFDHMAPPTRRSLVPPDPLDHRRPAARPRGAGRHLGQAPADRRRGADRRRAGRRGARRRAPRGGGRAPGRGALRVAGARRRGDDHRGRR